MGSHRNTLLIKRLVCKNFRCFPSLDLTFNSRLSVCEDANGTGKTSFLEALYYAGYLRSFRTHLPREMVQFGSDNFFVKVELEQGDNDANGVQHEIQVGFSHGKRLARVNKQQVICHKDIIAHYRVVSITEDDLSLVKGAPEVRRDFLDLALAMQDQEYRLLIKSLKQTVANRNALLAHGRPHNDMYLILSRKLAEVSDLIKAARASLLDRYAMSMNATLSDYLSRYTIGLSYVHKKQLANGCFDTIENCKELFEAEAKVGRSLWGAHLDDFLIVFNDNRSKSYASRGQQKLIVTLMKMAHVEHLVEQYGSVVILLDDFVTDLDDKIACYLVDRLLCMDSQLIFTAPTNQGTLVRYLKEQGAEQFNLAC